MDYKMNIGNELAQAKYCKSRDELKRFIEDHNLKPTSIGYDSYEDVYRFNAEYTDEDVVVKISVMPYL